MLSTKRPDAGDNDKIISSVELNVDIDTRNRIDEFIQALRSNQYINVQSFLILSVRVH